MPCIYDFVSFSQRPERKSIHTMFFWMKKWVLVTFFSFHNSWNWYLNSLSWTASSDKCIWFYLFWGCLFQFDFEGSLSPVIAPKKARPSETGSDDVSIIFLATTSSFFGYFCWFVYLLIPFALILYNSYFEGWICYVFCGYSYTFIFNDHLKLLNIGNTAWFEFGFVDVFLLILS